VNAAIAEKEKAQREARSLQNELEDARSTIRSLEEKFTDTQTLSRRGSVGSSL